MVNVNNIKINIVAIAVVVLSIFSIFLVFVENYIREFDE